MTAARRVNIGLIGLGAVGAGFARVLAESAEDVKRRCGLELCLRRIADRDPARAELLGLDPELVAADPAPVVLADDVDVVVELIGGMEPARSLVLEAFRQGKSVVTANKEIVAGAWDELHAEAERAGVAFRYSASAGGSIPIIPVLRDRLVGDRVFEMLGILNGTTNFVLTAMGEGARGIFEALEEARRLGFAEADPSQDVSGRDSARKLAILSQLAFGRRVNPESVSTAGIQAVCPEDFKAAQRLGFELKLVAAAREHGDGLDLSVAPSFLPAKHPLASVAREHNAIHLRTRFAGEATLVGKGAGPEPTGAAVLADVVDAILRPEPTVNPVDKAEEAVCGDRHGASAYLRFPVEDRSGVIGRIATALGERGVGIETAHAMLRTERPGSGFVEIVTHPASQKALRHAFDAAKALDDVGDGATLIRIEGASPESAPGEESLRPSRPVKGVCDIEFRELAAAR